MCDWGSGLFTQHSDCIQRPEAWEYSLRQQGLCQAGKNDHVWTHVLTHVNSNKIISHQWTSPSCLTFKILTLVIQFVLLPPQFCVLTTMIHETWNQCFSRIQYQKSWFVVKLWSHWHQNNPMVYTVLIPLKNQKMLACHFMMTAREITDSIGRH